MIYPTDSGVRVLCLAWLFLCLVAPAWTQSHSNALPRFEDYKVSEIFTGAAAVPKLVTPLEQGYADQIKDGVERGYGVFRDRKEQKGPNFAGHLIVIEWGCGAPCIRMAIVDARTGEVYYPPIAFNGVGARSFDLPLLTVGESVPRNPEVQFRLDSSLMIIKATPKDSGHHAPHTYYFLWRKNRWTLLQKAPVEQADL